MKKIIYLDDYRKGGVNYRFDHARISNNEVSHEEIADLEERIVELFFKRAKKEGKKVIAHFDDGEYEVLRRKGKLFDDCECHILIDKTKTILDLSPLLYHLSDTDEARFYAKFRLHHEGRQKQVQQ